MPQPNVGWNQIILNCRSCKSTLVESINTNMELEMSIIGPLRFADQYCSSSNGAWRVLCLVFFNIQVESQGKEDDTGRLWTWTQDKDNRYCLRPLCKNMKRSAIATQCHCGLCWTAEPEQSVKQSRRTSFLNVIRDPFRPQEMKCLCLCLPDWLCIFQPAMRDSITQWLNAIH